MWITRTMHDRLTNLAATRPALLLTGMRQSGKSSLLQRVFPDAEYISFDHLDKVNEARESPGHFLAKRGKQVILDEIQYVPELFRELKIIIDKERNIYGRWILTGSQQFALMDNISDSLAGRISILHLETLSAGELRSSESEALSQYIWKGGYPELWANPGIDSNDFFESYIRTYIERDLKSIIEVKNLNDFRRFFRVLATRTGQLINYRDMGRDCGVSDMTIRKWLHALETGGVVYLLPPFYANINKRLAKSPKLYFADHGLLSHLLGIHNADEWFPYVHRGALWENLVCMELIKSRGKIPGQDLFFYRDQNGVEIDFVIEEGQKLHLIEAKSGERPDKQKLNFNKVAPLFKAKYTTTAIVALNTPDPGLHRYQEYSSYNPILTDWS